MNYKNDFSTTCDGLIIPDEYLAQKPEQGLEGLPELIRVVVNKAMRLVCGCADGVQ